MENVKHAKKDVIFFIVIALMSGWIGVFVDTLLPDQPEGDTLGMGIFLVLPFLTAMYLTIRRGSWTSIGMKPHVKGNGKWYIVALAIYPIIMIVTVGIALALGVAHVSDIEIASLLSVIGIALLANIVKNIFEEFSWRGYLTPRLMELQVNDWLIYLISGLVWALWHAPYYFVFLPDHFFESTSRMGFLLTGCVLMVCWSVMYVEIYRITKSVWPGVFMHAVEDAIPNVLVLVSGVIVFTNSGDFWLNPITGVVATISFLGIGLVLRSIRITKGTT